MHSRIAPRVTLDSISHPSRLVLACSRFPALHSVWIRIPGSTQCRSEIMDALRREEAGTETGSTANSNEAEVIEAPDLDSLSIRSQFALDWLWFPP
jgi:hypothetical protein